MKLSRFAFVPLMFIAYQLSAQIAPFQPCKFDDAAIASHADGVTTRTLSIQEGTESVRATALIPDSPLPVPGILFTHAAIQGPDSRADLLVLAHALALAGAASVVLDGTIQWVRPNSESGRPPHLMACAGQWLLLNANLDTHRLATAGPFGGWGGGDTPFCLPKEHPCWHANGGAWLNFGQTSDAEYHNTNAMLTAPGRLQMARFAEHALKLKHVEPDWLEQTDSQ